MSLSIVACLTKVEHDGLLITEEFIKQGKDAVAQLVVTW